MSWYSLVAVAQLLIGQLIGPPLFDRDAETKWQRMQNCPNLQVARLFFVGSVRLRWESLSGVIGCMTPTGTSSLWLNILNSSESGHLPSSRRSPLKTTTSAPRTHGRFERSWLGTVYLLDLQHTCELCGTHQTRRQGSSSLGPILKLPRESSTRG